MYSDPLEDFRNNFFQKLESEKKQKEIELKRVQKNCLHKYTRITPYNEHYSIASCERCKHNKFFKT
jgi:hypothetical protein